MMMIPQLYAAEYRGTSGPLAWILTLTGHVLTWRELAATSGRPEDLAERDELDAELRGLLFPAGWVLRVNGWAQSVHRSRAAADQRRGAILSSRRYRWSTHQPPVEVHALATMAEVQDARREAMRARGTARGGR